MEREAVMAALGIDPAAISGSGGAGAGLWSPEAWERSQAGYAGEGSRYLSEAYIADAGRTACLDERDVRLAAETAALVARSEPLARFAWHLHVVSFRSGPDGRNAVRNAPQTLPGLGERSGLFYLVVLLSGIDRWREVAQRRPLPADLARATLRDIHRKLGEHERWYGVRGLVVGSFVFLVRHLYGEILELGRLQFEVGAFRGPVRVLRRRGDGAVLAVAVDGTRYTRDGRLLLSANAAAPDSWVARCEEENGTLRAHPVRSVGEAVPRRCRLALAEWEEVLAPGDPVLHLHIPSGEPLDPARCAASFREAERIFPQYMPEHSFKAFALSTWFLDPHLEEVLPPSANIVRFARQFYRHPSMSNPASAFRFVFGPNHPADLDALPRETTLQRVLVDHVRAGGTWHGGSGFILRGEADGSERYRLRDLPADLAWE